MPFGDVEDPITADERADVASTCVEELDLPMPALIDGLDDKVNQAYGGWPDRLYLVGTDGTVRWRTESGALNYDPSGLEGAIRSLVPEG